MAERGNRRSRRHRRSIILTGMLGGLIALAVWGKLRFVSDVPRMAYADPKQQQQAADRGAAAD